MVDDLICVTECGHQSSMMNGYINWKTNSKKLMFGVDKCVKSPCGKNFRNLVKNQVENKTLEKLKNLKESHSKVKDVQHNCLVMQKYIQPNSTKISKEEAQLIFKLRCRVTKVKTNLKRNLKIWNAELAN